MTCMVSSRPKQGKEPFFQLFRCSNDFITQKVYFSRLMQNYVGLIMLALSPGFLASYWSAGFGTFLQVSALASNWLEDCANCTPTPEKNDKYIANHSQCNTTSQCTNYSILHLELAGNRAKLNFCPTIWEPYAQQRQTNHIIFRPIQSSATVPLFNEN